MQDEQFSQDGNILSSPASEPSFPPTDGDAGLLALEAQFDSLVAELLAAQNASDKTATDPDGQLRDRHDVLVEIKSYTDHEEQTEKTDAILARLHPIERAIMTTPARTIKGLGVKARHAAYVMSHYWEEPIEQIDWGARAMRLLIEAVCGLAEAPVPGYEAAAELTPNAASIPSPY
ncbi:conserved protein of unknown function [Bradyrhizobium sp. ORS 285]|uniref:hypothetical protein n=1 Tax=Bradyrhizobium sp. ORS 285 TaxID=115808 RepID=UPI000683071F|nr:hypothetical protein [Bradyrhizobium sp. ORS 285]SMX55533.1 conserved protein of unknown function [Bradyrhizobium sp. ORS 285]